MRVALDSNVLLYAEALDDERRANLAIQMVARLPAATVIGVQVLGEFYNVLVRKGGYERPHAAELARRWRARYAVAETTDAVVQEALSLASAHGLSIWDAVHLAAAAAAGCGLFLSEDLQHGFCWRGVTVVNPFLQPAHPLLAAALEP